MATQGAQLPAGQGMGARSAVLEPSDVQGGCFEIDLVPAQVNDFSWPQPVPKGQEHHESIAMTIAVSFGRLDQPLDLIDGQVLPCPKISVFGSPWRDCSIFS